MCDTFVILPKYTENGKTLFGKNSDRDPDEVQNVIFIPGRKYNPDEVVNCTYITIPQVEQTYDVILSQPFWMWGGEMGVNQFGLTIGNEAVFTNEPIKKSALLGMDLIRLALERTKTAKSALDCIINLLNEYGQGGGCGYHDRSFTYHNSWLIADPAEAYVLETADEHWVWKKVEKNYSISNTLTIKSDYDGISEGTVSYAIDTGRCKSEDDFSFKKCFTARGLKMKALEVIFSKGEYRQQEHHTRICDLIGVKKVSITDCIEILRSHNVTNYSPDKGSNKDLCTHSSWGIIRISASTNSFVAELDKELTSTWTTFGSAPCIQTFRPLFLSSEDSNSIPEEIRTGSEFFDEEAIWWRNERFHRIVEQDYTARIALFTEDRNKLETGFIEEVNQILGDFQGKNSDIGMKLKKVSSESMIKADKFIESWTNSLRNTKIENGTKRLFRSKWNKLNIKNKLNL